MEVPHFSVEAFPTRNYWKFKFEDDEWQLNKEGLGQTHPMVRGWDVNYHTTLVHIPVKVTIKTLCIGEDKETYFGPPIVK